ncbi:MAG: ROK family protein, partial [Halanaerobiales bacterium]
YGKTGSFEGFCSGGGIARLARSKAKKAIKKGNPPSFCQQLNDLNNITAKKVGIAASEGDELARNIFKIVGEKLGYGLSILLDIINPEKIIIGSIYSRQKALLEPVVLKKVKEEALSPNLSACDIVPAELGEKIGEYASISVILELMNSKNESMNFDTPLKFA